MEKVLVLRSPARSQAWPASRVICWVNRLALAIVFGWFGLLKVLHLSPAEQLVTHLHQVTIARFMDIGHFMILLGGVECAIGLLWLVPRLTRYAFGLFLLQMGTTFLPLFLLRSETWQNAFALTLTGQYIMKNLVLVASALSVVYLQGQSETR
ncbi:MAG TPA: hypothetical protein VG870_12220 [Chitinophagaceae bacterium]|nr:hypothetical protein [Chitinophagaceae bacterium]